MSLLSMTSLVDWLDPATYPFITILIFWLIGSILGSLAGGWFTLSLRFSSHAKPCGEVHIVRPFLSPVYFRYWVHVDGVRMIAAEDALYLSVIFLFRLGHPPLRIPWNEIQFTTSNRRRIG